MKGCPALAAITKPLEQRLEIKGTDHIGDETRQMLLREPVDWPRVFLDTNLAV